MLAACCKPSSGAGVNWMDLAQVLAWRKPGHVNGDRHKVPEQSYHLATTPGRWTSRNNDARRLDHKCNHKPNLDRKVTGSNPKRTMLPRLQSRDNCSMERAYYDACWSSLIIVCER